jgi:hypothetical protein
VKATDTGADEVADTFDDLMSFSRYFNVTVDPVNDAPVLSTASELLAVNESDTLTFTVTVSDIDDDAFEWDSNLTDKVDVVPDTLNSSLAEITFDHDSSDVSKTHHFYVKVWDSGGSEGENFIISDSINFTVDVINLNDPPKLVRVTILPDEYSEPIVDGSPSILKNENAALEDELFELSFKATDPDIGFDPLEELTFSLSVQGTVDGELSIDPETGKVSFIPTNADVGTVRFNVTVTDRLGESDTSSVELQVKNTNDAPLNVRIIQPERREFNTSEKIQFKGEASDDDLELWNTQEQLTFLWSTNKTTVVLGFGDSLDDISLEEGLHNITLKVTDVAGAAAFDYIELLITPPDETEPDPDDKDKDKDNDTDPKDDTTNDPKTQSPGDEKSSNSLYMMLMAILIAVVIVVIVLYSLMRRKKDAKPDEVESEGEMPAGQPGAMPMMPGQVQNGFNGQMYQTPYGFQQPFPAQQQMPMQYPQAPEAAFQQPAALPAAEVQTAPEAAQTEPAPAHVEGEKPSTADLENVDTQNLMTTKPVDK